MVADANGMSMPMGARVPALSLALARDPNTCLGATSDAVGLSPCDGSDAQRFILSRGQVRRGDSCLDVAGEPVAGSALSLAACDPNRLRQAQLWSYRGETLSVQNTSFCLDTNAPVPNLQGCSAAPSQSFALVTSRAKTGVALSAALDPTRCLADPNTDIANGALPALAACDRGERQLWSRQGDHLMVHGHCLDIPLATTASGTPVQLFECVGGSDFQRFILEGGMLRPALDPAKCVELAGPDASVGQRLRLGDCTGAPHQLWDVGGDVPAAGPAALSK
jgi:hypothetical protein